MKSNVRSTVLRRAIHVPLILLALLLLQALPASAAPPETFPSPIPLPDGFGPEGIAVGRGSAFYVGSIPTGSIYRGDLRTGEGEILVQHDDRVAIGLSVDERTNYLFAAGGGTGNAYVYDAATGATVGVLPLTAPGTFVNDVIVTRDAAYFTDSFRPFFYRLPLGPGGALPDPASATEIELTGDFTSVPGYNTNGIDATPNGRWLLIVNSSLGTLYSLGSDSVERDYAAAMRLWARAAAGGHEDSRIALRRLAGREIRQVEQTAVELLGTQPGAFGAFRKVRVERANIRGGPGTGHRILAVAKGGDSVVPFLSEGDWVKIGTFDPPRIGWIYGRLIGSRDQLAAD